MNIQNTTLKLIEVGLTQSQIGLEIKRSQATVSDMAAGVSGCLRPSNDVVEGLKRLAKKYKIKLN